MKSRPNSAPNTEAAQGKIWNRHNIACCAEVFLGIMLRMTLPGNGCADISYIPMRWGFLYLAAVMDWHSRKVLSWRLSNSLDAGFCVEAWIQALARYGPPEIFNSDQGSQFTSTDFTDVLHGAKVKISIDGRGRWIDNRMIERFWRSLKYECVYLNAFETGSEARAGIGTWITYYNEQRPHSSHGLLTPGEAYDSRITKLKAAA